MKRSTRLDFYATIKFNELKEFHSPKHIINTGLSTMSSLHKISFERQPADVRNRVYRLTYDDDFNPLVEQLISEGHKLNVIFQTAISYAHEILK